VALTGSEPTLRKRILLLSFQFPPGRGSGIYRIRAWANGLAQAGHDVRVLTVERQFYEQINGSFDEQLVATIDDRVAISRFRFRAQHMQQDVKRMSWVRGNFTSLHADVHSRVNERIFPEAYAHVYPIMVGRGLAIAARWRPDLIVATGNPYAQLAAAHRLGTILKRPYVVDYHDAWTLNQYTESDSFDRDAPQWKWERRIIENAALTVTINKPLADWYRSEYPLAHDRIREYENGFDPEAIGAPTWGPAADPVRFGYVGTIRGDIPLEELSEGWIEARRTDPGMSLSTFVYHGHVGFFSWNERAIKARIVDPKNGISHAGPFSQADISKIYEGLDVLVLSLMSSPYVSSGKVFDYMASGKVIVGLFNDSTQAHEILKDYPLYVPVGGLDQQSVAAAMTKAAATARGRSPEQVQQAWRVAKQHSWANRFEPLIEEVTAIASERS